MALNKFLMSNFVFLIYKMRYQSYRSWLKFFVSLNEIVHIKGFKKFSAFGKYANDALCADVALASVCTSGARVPCVADDLN